VKEELSKKKPRASGKCDIPKIENPNFPDLHGRDDIILKNKNVFLVNSKSVSTLKIEYPGLYIQVK